MVTKITKRKRVSNFFIPVKPYQSLPHYLNFSFFFFSFLFPLFFFFALEEVAFGFYQLLSNMCCKSVGEEKNQRVLESEIENRYSIR